MDVSPLAILQYALDTVGPYLPGPIQQILRLSLRGMHHLPSSVANVLPLLLAVLAVYTSVMSMYSTARSAFRMTWFLLKWGGVAAIVAWASGIGTGGGGQAAGVGRGAGGYNNAGLGGMADYVQQAAAAAGIGGAGNNNNNYGFLNNFIPAPLRAVGDVVNFFSGSPDNGASSSSSSKRSTRSTERQRKQREAEQAEQLQNMGNVATSWLGGMAGKAWEVFNNPENADRWDESRNRRQQRNR